MLAVCVYCGRKITLAIYFLIDYNSYYSDSRGALCRALSSEGWKRRPRAWFAAMLPGVPGSSPAPIRGPPACPAYGPHERRRKRRVQGARSRCGIRRVVRGLKENAAVERHKAQDSSQESPAPSQGGGA